MATAVVGEQFNIGRVIQRTFTTLGRNFAMFALVAAAFVGLPGALFGYGSTQLKQSHGPGSFVGGAFWMVLAGMAVALVGSGLSQGAIIHAAISDFNGRRSSLGESLRVALRNWVPLFLIALLSGLGVVLASVLLIVPGVMLAVVWAVALPVQVVEHTGAGRALNRSADLTRGRRWSVFGVFAIFLLAALIIQLIVVAVGATLPGGVGGPTAQMVTEAVVNPVISTLAALIGHTGVASLYHELRVSKEGAGVDVVASVFD